MLNKFNQLKIIVFILMAFMIFSSLFFSTGSTNSVSAQYVSSSPEFQNAASVITKTFKNTYGDIDYLTFDGKPFDQGFIDACTKISLHNCQGLVRTVTAGAIAHAFLYRTTGNSSDLDKAIYLITKTINLYGYWNSTSGSWILNSIGPYSLGLAAWLIWDNLDATLQNSVKNIIVTEANFWLQKNPYRPRGDWGPLSWGQDTKAEENSAVTSLFTMAAQFFPEEPNAQQWKEKARCFAYHSLTVGKDQPFCNTKTITVFDNGDEIGTYRASSNGFYLDYDGDQWWSYDTAFRKITIPVGVKTYITEDADRFYTFGSAGDLPIAGDWLGNDLSKIGVYRPSDNRFYLDMDGDGVWNSANDLTTEPFEIASDTSVGWQWVSSAEATSFYDASWLWPPENTIGINGSSNICTSWVQNSGWCKKTKTGNDSITLKFSNKVKAEGIEIYSAGPVNEGNYDFAKVELLNLDSATPVWETVWQGANNECVFKINFSAKNYLTDTVRITTKSGSWGCVDAVKLIGSGSRFTYSQPVIGDWNSDVKDEIGIFGYDNNNSAFFALDWNGNKKWDGNVIDKLVYFGEKGDIPIAGKWNNSSRSYIGVYRPGNFTFYLDWDGDFVWNAAIDKSFYFWKAPAPSVNLQPLVGDWNETGKETVGLFDADAAVFYLDYNNDFAWDNINDMKFDFGQKDDKPISGRWQKRENFWLANHSMRPYPGYMGSTLIAFQESFLVYKKVHQAMPSEFFHNMIPLWNKLKEYLNTTNFKWKIDEWGLQPSGAAFICLALNTDCDLEKRLLEYKATDSQESSFIIISVPKQTMFTFNQYTIWNYEDGARRYIITALSHDDSFLPSLPLTEKDTIPPAAPTGVRVN